jgi:hypothetical protein
MRFTVLIQQNVSGLNIAMQNAVFVRIMNGTRHLRDEFRRASNWDRLALDYFVKLTAFDELHAEVALTVPLAYFVNRNNARMFQAGGSFRFPAEALQVCFGRPSSQANHFERDGAIETYLPRPINYTLPTPTNFLQQLVVAEFGLNLCGVQRLLQKRRHRSVKKTQTAESLWRIREELAPAFAANAGHIRCLRRH